MKLYKSITIFFVLSMISFGTLASEKYCLKEETTKPIVVNIFGQSYQNNDDKRDFINGLNIHLHRSDSTMSNTLGKKRKNRKKRM